jgi:hypothetical protein
MKKIEVIDNFLPTDLFLDISDFFFSDKIVWYWNEFKTTHEKIKYDDQLDELDDFQYIHPLYNFNKPVSNVNIQVFIDALNMKHIVKAKANSTIRMNSIFRYGFHTDVGLSGCKTSIFYMNTNDGFTEFENGDRIESIANRMITFDSSLKHTGTSCTNKKRRIVLNFNYFNHDNF